jgi:hypothetical protein
MLGGSRSKGARFSDGQLATVRDFLRLGSEFSGGLMLYGE